MHCLAIRHVAFEHLGSFASVIAEAGFAVDYIDIGIAPVAPKKVLDTDLLIVLGGPVGVNDSAHYPFIAQEIDLIAQRIAANKPVIGICLGAQMIAAASGARVYQGREKEIGWGPVTLTEAGRCSRLGRLENTPVLHWHGDTFDLPHGATLLASTTITTNQAFSIGSNVLALQFHVEVQPTEIEAWLVGHACELSLVGARPERIRADTIEFGAAAVASAQSLLRGWLQDAGLWSPV